MFGWRKKRERNKIIILLPESYSCQPAVISQPNLNTEVGDKIEYFHSMLHCTLTL